MGRWRIIAQDAMHNLIRTQQELDDKEKELKDSNCCTVGSVLICQSVVTRPSGLHSEV